MLYILPTVVLQVEAYLYYETPNKTILSSTLSGVIVLVGGVIKKGFTAWFCFMHDECFDNRTLYLVHKPPRRF